MRSTFNTPARGWLLWAWLLCVAAGCQGPSSVLSAEHSDAGAGSNLSRDGGERWALSATQLDGFIRYQRVRVDLYRSLLRDLERVSARDAGVQRTLEVVQAKAHAEEQARTAAHLSETEARAIEALVSPIVEKRSLARSFDPEGALAHWEKMKDQIPADQRADLDQSMDELRRRRDEATRLEVERQRFGNAAVDLVLAREDDLLKNEAAWLKVLTGRKP